MQSLIITTEYFQPTYHGYKWPPAPLRLYQALLRGSYEGSRRLRWAQDGQLAEAFRWLEQQECELIIAPKVERGEGRTHWVRLPEEDPTLKTEKKFHPYYMRDGQQIHYVWPLRKGGEKFAEIIAREASHLLALGWGIDKVVGRGYVGEVVHIPGERWELQDGYGHSELRHPVPGTLDDLMARHAAKYRSTIPGDPMYPIPDLSVYTTRWYAHAGRTRPYAAFSISGKFPAHRASHVASMMRHMAIQNRHGFAEKFPGVDTEIYLAGHVGKARQTPPRFSYLVLPTIGPYGDGYIRRVMFTEPYGSDGLTSKWAANVLDGQMLQGEKDGKEYMLESLPPDGVVRQYVQPGRIWRTVTPVVLHGWHNGSGRKANKLLDRALENAGITDTVDDIWYQPGPFFPGGLHSTQYYRPRQMKNGLCVHVGIKFREEVAGPLALGSGRHRGLGIMTPAGR